jgi:hypothetical protein
MGRQIGERIGLLPVVDVITIRELRRDRLRSALYCQDGQAVRVLHRQRTKEEGVNDGENRPVCADPQRECEDCDNREAPAFPQHAHTELHVLPESSH